MEQRWWDVENCGVGAGDPHRDEVLATQIRPADTTFATRAHIDLGDRAAELAFHGRGHTGGDVVLTVSGTPVLVAGDLVEESAPPAMGEDSYPLEWAATHDRVLDATPGGAAVVPGHGRPVDLAFARTQRDELAAVAGTIRRLAAEGVPAEAALAAGDWPYPPEHLADAVRVGYDRLAGDRG